MDVLFHLGHIALLVFQTSVLILLLYNYKKLKQRKKRIDEIMKDLTELHEMWLAENVDQLVQKATKENLDLPRA